MKYLKIVALSSFVLLALYGCINQTDEITDIDYLRLFSPQKFEARVTNKVNVRLQWSVDKLADSYTVEVFANDSLTFAGEPVQVIDGITAAELPYTVTGLIGETGYSARVKAVSSTIPESKWTGAYFKTDAEQIMLPVDPDEITATSVILHWTPGEPATNITLNPGGINYDLTPADIANGSATITGLTAETNYTAKLTNGTTTRGSATFTTLIDLGGAIAVYPEDDLAAILNAANDGDAFVLFPGEYALGKFTITQSVSISGYKTNDKPIITGAFTCATSVAEIQLKSLYIKNDAEKSLKEFFNITAAGITIGKLSFIDLEINAILNQLIYNNFASNVNEILISGCYIHDMDAGGGDFIDFRQAVAEVGSLKIENSTFSNGIRTFMRMQAICGPVEISHCTFYNVCQFDNTNNTGFFRIPLGTGTFKLHHCLFANTGPTAATPAAVCAGNLVRQANYLTQTPSFEKNGYYDVRNFWVGLYTTPGTCDAAEYNPGFVDAAGGNLKVTNEDVIAYGIGDPRWR
jgi:hypothetical protein